MSEMANNRVLTAEVSKTPGVESSLSPPAASTRPPTVTPPTAPTTASPTTQHTRMDQASDSDENHVLNLKLYTQDMSKFDVTLLDFEKNATQQGSVCNGGFCCDYHIEVVPQQVSSNESLSYSYAVVAFDGLREYPIPEAVHTGVMACAVIACTSPGSFESCGKR